MIAWRPKFLRDHQTEDVVYVQMVRLSDRAMTNGMCGVGCHALECSYSITHISTTLVFFDRESGLFFYILHKIVYRVYLCFPRYMKCT